MPPPLCLSVHLAPIPPAPVRARGEMQFRFGKERPKHDFHQLAFFAPVPRGGKSRRRRGFGARRAGRAGGGQGALVDARVGRTGRGMRAEGAVCGSLGLFDHTASTTNGGPALAAIQTIQLLGMLGTFSYVLARAARASGVAAFHRYAIVSQPRDRLPAMPAGYRVEALDAAALGALVQGGQRIDASAEVQALRFAAGLTCLGAFNRKDQLVGVIWLGTGRYDEDEVQARFLLPEGCCWDTGLWIAPKFRLGRAFAALWAGTGDWMAGRGLTHSLSRVSDYNLPAILSHKRMGARTLAHHTFIRVGAWQWSTHTRPRLVRGAGDGVPELDLRGVAYG